MPMIVSTPVPYSDLFVSLPRWIFDALWHLLRLESETEGFEKDASCISRPGFVFQLCYLQVCHVSSYKPTSASVTIFYLKLYSIILSFTVTMDISV